METKVLRPITEEEKQSLNMTIDPSDSQPNSICETIRKIHQTASQLDNFEGEVLHDPSPEDLEYHKQIEEIKDLCRTAMAMAKRINRRLIQLKQQDYGQDWAYTSGHNWIHL
jgi:hypothetical protein